MRIVRNEALNRVRRRRRQQLLAFRALDPAVPDPADEATWRAMHSDLVAALEGLDDHHREVVTLRYLLDLNEEETPAVLGIARGTVKSRIARAMDRLRATLAVERARDV